MKGLHISISKKAIKRQRFYSEADCRIDREFEAPYFKRYPGFVKIILFSSVNWAFMIQVFVNIKKICKLRFYR
jgi:hypothetical protein